MKFLFVIDPIKNINPLKDSTAALMQASSKKNMKTGGVPLKNWELGGMKDWASPVKVK